MISLMRFIRNQENKSTQNIIDKYNIIIFTIYKACISIINNYSYAALRHHSLQTRRPIMIHFYKSIH